MKKIKIFTSFLLLFIYLPKSGFAQDASLKTVFKNDFLIGTALGTSHILEQNETANKLIMSEFNSLTAENIMKAEVIHPMSNKYDFNLSDKFVAYGQKNKMHLVGHTLIWHSQLPKFVYGINNADTLKAFMEDHINTVVSRYVGKINSWDVVNEALNEDGTMRQSIFYKNFGDKYIKDAFDLAAKADPAAELYYNDYNIEQPAKRAGALAMIKKLQAQGTKINGVGIQGHWSVNGAPEKDLEDAIIEYSKLGLKVAITELDLTVIPNPWDLKGADVKQNFNEYIGDPKMNPFVDELPEEMQLKLAEKYGNLFKIFIKHKDKISRITFWGVNDGHSWLNNWPIRKRTNYPLLFDRNFEKKPAYDAVINTKIAKSKL